MQLWSQDRGSYTKANRGRTRSEKKKKNREKEAGVEVACRGHHRQEGIQEGENQGTKTKQTRETTYNMRRARKATICKKCKTAQIGRQSKDKDNECATQRNKMKEKGKGYSNQIK